MKFWQNSVLAGLVIVISAQGVAENRIETYDFNRDGKVSYEDINRYCDVSEKLFKFADKNGDGFLSESEMRTGREYLFSNCANKHKEEKRTK